jgi:hypothetical protein
MLTRYGPLEDFPQDALGERRELALLFKKLATLRTDAPLFTSVDELRWQGAGPDFPDCTRRMGAEPLIERAARALTASVSKNS